MAAEFTPGRGPIIVEVEVSGPAGAAVALLILDTGATTTVLHPGILATIGYDPDSVADRVPMTTVDGTCMAPRVTLNRLTTIGQHRLGFPVVCHALPSASGVKGLLGLDFFRDTLLTINFRQGRIEVA